MIRTASFSRTKKRDNEMALMVVRSPQMGTMRFIKHTEGWSWVPQMAPSLALLNAWRGGAIGNWEEYTKRYRVEMAQGKAWELITRLRKYAKEHDVVLVCYCPDNVPCHRNILKEILDDASTAKK